MMILAQESFWSISAAQIAMLLAILGGFVLWFSRFEGRVRSATEALKAMKADTEKTFMEIVERISSIDREGTRKSQQSIAADEKLYDFNSKRLDRLEAATLDLVPKVAAMAKDVEWIADKVRKNGSV